MDYNQDPKAEQPTGREASDLKPLLGCRLSGCEDVQFLRDAVELLFGLLDEIDTTSDIAKENDQWYRKRVEHLQAKRWESGIVTDGYDLFRKAT